MKIPRRWFSRSNFALSHPTSTATAVTLISAAAAMAFVAGGDRLVTVGRPSSELSQDREAKGKMGGDPDARPTNYRTTPGEGPIGGYEAYKSAVRTYPANVIPPSMVQNARNTFNKIAAQGDPGGQQPLAGVQGRCRTLSSPACSRSPVRPIQPQAVVQFSSSRRRACRVTAVSGWAPPAVAFGGQTDDALAADPSWTYLTGGIAHNSARRAHRRSQRL